MKPHRHFKIIYVKINNIVKFNCFAIFISYLLIVLFVIFDFANVRIANAINNEEILVSTNNNKNDLKDVLVKITQKYGWAINVDEHLSHQTITGLFQEEPLDSFLRRTLRKNNIIVTYRTEERIIDIYSFGSKNSSQIVSIGSSYRPQIDDTILDGMKPESDNLAIAEHNVTDNLHDIEPLTRMSLNEIAMIEQKENAIFDSYINDPNSLEPLTGMSLKEIELLQDRENQLYENYSTNPNSIEPLTGLTLREINIMQNSEVYQLEY